MPTTTNHNAKIPARFNDLVAMLAPRAIHDNIEYHNVFAKQKDGRR